MNEHVDVEAIRALNYVLHLENDSLIKVLNGIREHLTIQMYALAKNGDLDEAADIYQLLFRCSFAEAMRMIVDYTYS